MVERGREDGSVRAGITASDVIAFGAMLAQPLSGTPDWAYTARRQKMIFLAGVAGPTGALPSDTPTTAHEPEQRRQTVSFPPHAHVPSVPPSAAEGFVLGPDEGEAFWWLGTLTINKIRGASTAGGLDVVEHRVAPGYAPPRHVHQGQDEIFYLVDGEFVIDCGDQRWDAAPGSGSSHATCRMASPLATDRVGRCCSTPPLGSPIPSRPRSTRPTARPADTRFPCTRPRSRGAGIQSTWYPPGLRRVCTVAPRWALYLQVLREIAQHAGHADILREQVISGHSG